MKISVQVTSVILLFVLIFSSEVHAQKWTASFAYANTKPATEFNSQNFHGINFSIKRSLLKRLFTGINFSIFAPAKIDYNGGFVSSRTKQSVLSTQVYTSYDVVQSKYVDFYFKTGYGYIRHRNKGTSVTFIYLLLWCLSVQISNRKSFYQKSFFY